MNNTDPHERLVYLILGMGTIIAQITTARAAIPVENAALSVLSEKDGQRQLLGFRISSLSGLTEPISLEAPSRENSQHPSAEPAFSSYTLQVDHPLYRTIVVEGVQVFDGETSVQTIDMLPLEENPSALDKLETFQVPPQNL